MYDLIVHSNVDPDRYFFLDLMYDVCKSSLSHIPTNIDLSFTIECDVPGWNEKMTMLGD